MAWLVKNWRFNVVLTCVVTTLWSFANLSTVVADDDRFTMAPADPAMFQTAIERSRDDDPPQKPAEPAPLVAIEPSDR